MVAAAGPRLATVIRIRMSSASALAYSAHDIEVAVVVEDPGVEQLEFGLGLPALAVHPHQGFVGVLRLRILVERLQVGVRRRGVEVVVQLLHVLAVVPLGPGEPEEPLLQDGIAPVPERQREAEPALAVGDAEQSVLTPSVRAASGVVVRQVVPAVAVLRVVLPHRAPLPLGKVGSPPLPVPGPARCPPPDVRAPLRPRGSSGVGRRRMECERRRRGSRREGRRCGADLPASPRLAGDPGWRAADCSGAAIRRSRSRRASISEASKRNLSAHVTHSSRCSSTSSSSSGERARSTKSSSRRIISEQEIR